MPKINLNITLVTAEDGIEIEVKLIKGGSMVLNELSEMIYELVPGFLNECCSLHLKRKNNKKKEKETPHVIH